MEQEVDRTDKSGKASIHYRTSLERKQHLFETAAAQGRTVNDVLDELVTGYVDKAGSNAVKLNPLEIRRQQVVRELEATEEKLTALREKIARPKTKEHRSGIIAATLINTDPKYPPGPYAKLGENWKLIRLRALEDLQDKPDWAKQLRIRDRLEVDMACDQAQRVNDLVRLKKSLEHEDEVLNRKMATDTEVDPLAQEIAHQVP